MILEVDMGNSRFKWRMIDSDHGSKPEVVPNKTPMDYGAIFQGLEAPKSIRASCVKHGLREGFSSWCHSFWGLEPRFASVSRSCGGVVNGYEDTTQMGVDRWLAMLGAFKLNDQQSILVVDVGTAMTIDLVLASGQHVGGYITPGFELMRSALMGGTEINDIENRDTNPDNTAVNRYDEFPVAGKSTKDAISEGIRSLQLGHIILAVSELAAVSEAQPSVVFTGGGGEVMAKTLKQKLSVGVSSSGFRGANLKKVRSIAFVPTLVLDGLSLALS
jgi:type III pantothenate kinase